MQVTNDLAYWIGVAQSDGSLKSWVDNARGFRQYCVAVGVGEKSLPMIEKFQKLSVSLFQREAKIFKLKCGLYDFKIGVNRLLEEFKALDIDFKDPPKPPRWMNTAELFGAYLAGVIDGDGNIHIHRPKYPQCLIRIFSGSPQPELSTFIREKLRCNASISKRHHLSFLGSRRIEGHSYVLQFCVSKKTVSFIKNNVLPYLTINHKREKLSKFINYFESR